jgi:putative lipoprotein
MQARTWIASALIFATACASPVPGVGDAGQHSEARMQLVTGTVSLPGHPALPPGAVVEVSLLDVSRADAPAVTVAQKLIENPSTFPVPFVLKFDAAQIDDRMSYSVRAVVRHAGRLLFTTDARYAVLTRGAGSTADLVLKRVGGPETKPDGSLTNTYWKLVSIGGEPYRHDGTHREPHLKLQAEGETVTGYGSCNSCSGRFERDGDMLRFRDLVVTQRACLQGTAVEGRFMAALLEVNRHEIQGDTLRLLRDDAALLGFEAVYF